MIKRGKNRYHRHLQVRQGKFTKPLIQVVFNRKTKKVVFKLSLKKQSSILSSEIIKPTHYTKTGNKNDKK